MLRRVFILLVGILAISMVSTSTIHAAEFPGAVTTDCVGAASHGHASDQNSSSEKSVPAAHANCHSPAVSLPTLDAPAEIAFMPHSIPAPHALQELVSLMVAPGIRPPIA